MKKFIIGLAIMAFTFVAANQTLAQSRYDVTATSPVTKQVLSAGTWTIGGRKNQPPIEIRFASGDAKNQNDGAKTSMGQVKYDQKEGMLGLKLLVKSPTEYSAFTKKGNADWVSDGNWVLMTDKNLTLVKFDGKSSDGGKTLVGRFGYSVAGKYYETDFKAVLK